MPTSSATELSWRQCGVIALLGAVVLTAEANDAVSCMEIAPHAPKWKPKASQLAFAKRRRCSHGEPVPPYPELATSQGGPSHIGSQTASLQSTRHRDGAGDETSEPGNRTPAAPVGSAFARLRAFCPGCGLHISVSAPNAECRRCYTARPQGGTGAPEDTRRTSIVGNPARPDEWVCFGCGLNISALAPDDVCRRCRTARPQNRTEERAIRVASRLVLAEHAPPTKNRWRHAAERLASKLGTERPFVQDERRTHTLAELLRLWKDLGDDGGQWLPLPKADTDQDLMGLRDMQFAESLSELDTRVLGHHTCLLEKWRKWLTYRRLHSTWWKPEVMVLHEYLSHRASEGCCTAAVAMASLQWFNLWIGTAFPTDAAAIQKFKSPLLGHLEELAAAADKPYTPSPAAWEVEEASSTAEASPTLEETALDTARRPLRKSSCANMRDGG